MQNITGNQCFNNIYKNRFYLRNVDTERNKKPREFNFLNSFPGSDFRECKSDAPFDVELEASEGIKLLV